MDDKSHQLLEELVNLQKKQNDLLGRHLTRIKFSLWSLLLLMTFTCAGLGAIAYISSQNSKRAARNLIFPAPSVPFASPAPIPDGTAPILVPPGPNADNPFSE
jgi:hypothetical protein